MNAGSFNAAEASHWWALAWHFISISLLAVGGAMSAAPEMQRYLVGERGWMDASQFSASIALAQAAPGPNVLFVAVLGYSLAGVPGAAVALLGTLLPSTVLTLMATRWAHHHREAPAVRAFTQGLLPLTLALLLCTAWFLLEPVVRNASAPVWPGAALALATWVLSVRARVHPVALIAAGGVLGALGWVG